MKSIYGILAGVISLAAMMVSCIAEPEAQEVDITTVHCSIPQIDVEEDFATGILNALPVTKATFNGTNFLWSTGDKIGIVPHTGAQIYFEVDEGAGTSTASFDGGDWAMKSTGTFYAYYPLYPDIFLSKNHVSVSYTGQTQSGNNNNLHTGNFWTLYSGGTNAVGNTLNFSFNHLTSFFKTYVTVPAGNYTKISFSAPSKVFIKDGYFDLSAQPPTIVGTTFTNELCLDLQNITFADETELTGYLVVAPVDITGIPITVTVYKDGAPAYEYTLTKANPMVAAKTYAFTATSITEPITLPSIGDILIESVDYRTAIVSSSLLNDGNAITEFGFYYGTSAGSMNTKLIASGGARGYSIGDFSKEITGLNPGTTYYIKAYATNEAGSVESAVQSFTTTSLAYYENGHNCGNGIEIVQKVGNTEKTVIWAPVNLGYYDTSNNKYLYGRLYQWGRFAGQGYAMNMITTASGDLYTYTDEKGKTVHVKVNNELPLTTPETNTHYSYTQFTAWDDDNEQYSTVTLPYWNGSWDHAFTSDWDDLEKDDYIGDPCPEGWRIPSSAELSGLIANKSSFITVNNQNGYYFYGLNSNGNRVFLPASGQGGPNPEAQRGTIGRYWSSRSSEYTFDGGEYWIYRRVGYYMQLDSSGASLKHDNDEYYDGKEDNWAFYTSAFSIRCVKEE